VANLKRSALHFVTKHEVLSKKRIGNTLPTFGRFAIRKAPGFTSTFWEGRHW
jgi:hypothetical protein